MANAQAVNIAGVPDIVTASLLSVLLLLLPLPLL